METSAPAARGRFGWADFVRQLRNGIPSSAGSIFPQKKMYFVAHAGFVWHCASLPPVPKAALQLHWWAAFTTRSNSPKFTANSAKAEGTLNELDAFSMFLPVWGSSGCRGQRWWPRWLFYCLCCSAGTQTSLTPAARPGLWWSPCHPELSLSSLPGWSPREGTEPGRRKETPVKQQWSVSKHTRLILPLSRPCLSQSWCFPQDITLNCC